MKNNLGAVEDSMNIDNHLKVQRHAKTLIS